MARKVPELWNESGTVSNEDQGDGPQKTATDTLDERYCIDSDELYTTIRSLTSLKVALNLSDKAKRSDAMQSLVLLSCPRVRILKAFRPRRSGFDEAGVYALPPGTDLDSLYTESILRDIITAIHKLPQPIWPPSLSSLRQLAIGLPSQEARGRAILLSTRVLPLFLLPILETVYLRGLALSKREEEALLQDDYDPDSFNIIPASSSSVRHVCLEACVGEDAKYPICNIVRACRSLETLILKSCEIQADFDWIISELKENHRNSLRTFFPCGDVSQLRGYRGAMYEDMYSKLRSLEVVPVDADEISGEIESMIHHEKYSDEEAFQLAFENLKGDIGDAGTLVLHGGEDLEDVCLLDKGLASLVSPKDVSSQKLKRIFLDKMIDILLRRQEIEGRAVNFPKTREAAERYGVRVHFEHGALDAFGEELCRNIFGVGLCLDQLNRDA